MAESVANPSIAPTIFAAGPIEAGKGGEGGDLRITNAEFVAAIFPNVPAGAFAAFCAKSGDPTEGGWLAERGIDALVNSSAEKNNYINCSSFYPGDDGTFAARKDRFAACHVLMLDDIGAKILFERFTGFEFSWLIETSPNNYQGGIIFAEPVTDGAIASRLHAAIIDAELCDAGAAGPMSRWARLPEAINGKPKYATDAGRPFRCRLTQWRPEKRYTPAEIVDRLKLDLASLTRTKDDAALPVNNPRNADDYVLLPRAAENPIVVALKKKGLYKTPLGSGKHEVSCPWLHEHTDALDTGAAYFEPDEFYPVGGFCCQHSHRDKYHIWQLLNYLGIPDSAARHKSVIRIVPGDLHRVVDAGERELAGRAHHYQSGGLIVSISTDPVTGDPSIIPTKIPALTRELSIAATWEQYSSRYGWFRCDPPSRHVGILYDAQSYRYLLPLAGLARQPFFRESDGVLVTQPGYDAISQRFGVFDPKQFPLVEPTLAAAQAALALLEELLTEFHFVSDEDKAAALSAIFTATVRPTLSHAPGFHGRAPVMGSGKTYLCELIGTFAGPAGNAKVSYPTTSEEATKSMLSLLLTNPAVIEFDDMDGDWIPHGTIKRMLTADQITDRILGYSKTATVSTRTLFLGSGNNVGPVRDLLRRVVTIHIDPRCATPATMSYRGSPVEKVRKQRGLYVGAVLTIILAWRKAGSPRADVENIVTFSGGWSDYCRHPLMWLGHPDPATTLIAQVRHDPDADALKGLMVAWWAAFKSAPTTVRKAVSVALSGQSDLLDAMREFPIEERGEINKSKLGWLLKKNANRIAGGFEFQAAEADGRNAWRVVPVKAATPSASFVAPVAEPVDITSIDDEVEQ